MITAPKINLDKWCGKLLFKFSAETGKDCLEAL
jgi:hypothetical protein